MSWVDIFNSSVSWFYENIGFHWKLCPIQYFISPGFFRHLCRCEANPCCGKYGNLTYMRLRCFTVIVQYLVQGFLSSGDESYTLLKFWLARAENIRTSFNASYSIYVRVQFAQVYLISLAQTSFGSWEANENVWFDSQTVLPCVTVQMRVSGVPLS